MHLGHRWTLAQWHVEALWRLGYTGAGVAVGHLDTGLDNHHPALQHQPCAFRYFDRHGFATEKAEPFDSAAHGTQTASLICGRAVHGATMGVAPDCALYSSAVLEAGDIISRILFGMAWMLECKVRVLCLPLGVPGYTPVFASMIHLLRQQGVLPVASIGNRGAGHSLSPGDYPGVLSVGAADAEGRAAIFSGSYHRLQQQACLKPDLLAPGTDILAARPGGGALTVSGTSMACALVAGVAALLMQAAPAAPPSLIEAALVNTAAPLPAAHAHRSRRGVMHPAAALRYILTHQEHWLSTAVSEEHADVPHDPLVPPHTYIDPRLRDICRYASDDYLVEAAFVTSDATEATSNADRRSVVEALVDRVALEQGEEAQRTRYIPSAGIAIVFAKAVLIRALMADPHVRVASATDVDRAGLG